MLWYVTPHSTRSSPTMAAIASALPMPFCREKKSVEGVVASSAAPTASPVWYVLTATNTRSNGSSPASEVTTWIGIVVSSWPTRVMWTPASASRRARAWFTSSSVTSSPARVRYAPTSPPSAPAPTIRIRIAPAPAALWRGSPVLPQRTSLLEERCDPLAHVLRGHQLTQEHALRLAPRLFERQPEQPAGEANVHPHHQRTRTPQVAQHLIERCRQPGLGHDARDEPHRVHFRGRVRASRGRHFDRPCEADTSGQQRHADRREEADPDLRLPERRALAGEEDVRHHHEFESRAQRRAVHRHHHRQLHRAECGKQAAERRDHLRRLLRTVLADVRAGRERPRCRLQHEGLERTIRLCPLDAVRQLPHHRRTQHIDRRRVEREEGHILPHLVPHRTGGHRHVHRRPLRCT